MKKWILIAAMLAPLDVAAAQARRIGDYQERLETRIEDDLREYRLSLLGVRNVGDIVGRAAARVRALARNRDGDEGESYDRPFESVVNAYESRDGDGQDVEIRITMPIHAYIEFAPVAALEAAAIPHKFPVVYIYLREETTDRVSRVAFRDAEPIAGRYLAGDEKAFEEMREALIWH